MFPAEDVEGLTPYHGPAGNESYARSYIAPNVSDFGEVISPAVYDEREFQSQELAMRARGQMEYSQLVSGGATPEEAYRRTAHLLNWNHPDKLAQALARIPGADTPFTPIIEDVEGGRVLRTSPRGAHFIRDMPPKMPQANADERKLIEGKLQGIRSDPFGLKAKPGEVEQLENRFRELGTNWVTTPQAMPGAPTQPIAPPPAENLKASAESVRAAYRAGKLSREEAKQQLKALGYD